MKKSKKSLKRRRVKNSRRSLPELGHRFRSSARLPNIRAYKDCAEFGRDGLIVQIFYDSCTDSLWTGFGADGRRTLDRLLEDCRDEFARRIFRSFAESQGTQLAEGCPIVESYGPYNGFGIYEPSVVYTLDVPRVVDFIKRVLLSLPDDGEQDLQEIRRRPILATTKIRLIDARCGQGQFRVDLEAKWNECAVLGCCEVLRATHMKIWRKSTDKVRLDPKDCCSPPTWMLFSIVISFPSRRTAA